MYFLTSVPEYNILVVQAYKVQAGRVYVKKPGYKQIALLSKTSAHFEHLDKHKFIKFALQFSQRKTQYWQWQGFVKNVILYIWLLLAHFSFEFLIDNW